MATIIISNLKTSEKKTFLHDLNSEEITQILGSIFLPLWDRDRPAVQLSTVYDGMNNPQTTYEGPFGFHDNKIFAIDFSKISAYLVI
ncbi:hypothetical protein [Dolichospermum circinale]|jgi:hypothetical protein|uniref:hypothetical protein n=1 Tax=Dolichospermum circinale TaxID=109265 RepID=UPI000415E16F|nr:hypothetical protein [Dolichospermum circinale]MBD1212518.1 hypothetical protein [Dolichospermum circinale Clear-D4]MDB9483013.1 hypothetical protein [Dolichospermum circinale CS-537/05]MDB9453099.1 hypothetical protein [Dolichospermum circinale CS-541/06]MDB9464281.1 hypothetical protein [Dolichospermum circinale CS-541/04]MDB9475449.1 hypothetical protein [Dolichospermum circinale CS-537/11]